MLIGDLNSRTGVLNDIMLLDQDNTLDSINFKYPNVINIFNKLNIPTKQNNADKKVINNNGRKLIELFNCQELCIVNGRIGADKHIGHKTCDNKSTVDYMICTPDLFPGIPDFTVELYCPLLSDKHNPIHVTINLANNGMQTLESNDAVKATKEAQYVVCKWDRNKKEPIRI